MKLVCKTGDGMRRYGWQRCEHSGDITFHQVYCIDELEELAGLVASKNIKESLRISKKTTIECAWMNGTMK